MSLLCPFLPTNDTRSSQWKFIVAYFMAPILDFFPIVAAVFAKYLTLLR